MHRALECAPFLLEFTLFILSAVTQFYSFQALARLLDRSEILINTLLCNINSIIFSVKSAVLLLVSSIVFLCLRGNFSKRLLTRSVSLDLLISSTNFHRLITVHLCVIQCQFSAAFFALIEPSANAICKPNSISTLKGNYYETNSRCRRRGGWS